MKIFPKILTLFLFLTLFAAVTRAADMDFLARLAEQSEIKSIAVVSKVQRMGPNADGTFLYVTFKRGFSVSSFTPDSFVGGCKTMESRWQKRSPGTVYFNPKPGQKVYVTVTTDGGAITSYTLLTPQLEAVIRTAPERLAYSKGRAEIIPRDF
jgi:hypothetical protein